MQGFVLLLEYFVEEEQKQSLLKELEMNYREKQRAKYTQEEHTEFIMHTIEQLKDQSLHNEMELEVMQYGLKKLTQVILTKISSSNFS
jgi:hypothetical protein